MTSQNCEQWDVKSQVYSGGCEEAVNEFLETNIDIIGGAKSCFGMQNLCSIEKSFNFSCRSFLWIDRDHWSGARLLPGGQDPSGQALSQVQRRKDNNKRTEIQNDKMTNRQTGSLYKVSTSSPDLRLLPCIHDLITPRALKWSWINRKHSIIRYFLEMFVT